MSKKHKRVKRKVAKAQKAANNVVWHQSVEEATLAKKPRYNGFACGHGAHGNAKYDRNKQKREWRKQFDRSQYDQYAVTRYDKKGASRGSFLFLWARACCRPVYSLIVTTLQSLYDRLT